MKRLIVDIENQELKEIVELFNRADPIELLNEVRRIRCAFKNIVSICDFMETTLHLMKKYEEEKNVYQ